MRPLNDIGIKEIPFRLWQVAKRAGARGTRATFRDLAAKQAAIVDRLLRLIPAYNELTGRVNEVVDRNNQLTRLNSQLTRLNSQLTRLNNELTGRVNELSGERFHLFQRINTLCAQVTAGGTRSRVPPFTTATDNRVAAQAIARDKTHSGERSKRRSKFLIVSNMRSGSTWLETLLGALADVFTDFEFKLAITYQPSVGHYVLDEHSSRVTDVLEEMASDAPVVGSKFVFDAELTRPDIIFLQTKLGPDIRIIHLTRSYRDVFLSRRRGFYHQLNAAVAERVGKEIKAAIIRAEPLAQSNGASIVAKLDCVEELQSYVRNDASTTLLRTSGHRYLHVSYDEINARLVEIARFVASTATPAEIADVLSNPSVLKLPSVSPNSLVSNIAELDPLFEIAEGMRQILLQA